MGVYFLSSVQLWETALPFHPNFLNCPRIHQMTWGENQPCVFISSSFQSTKLAPRKPPEAFLVSLTPVKSPCLECTHWILSLTSKRGQERKATYHRPTSKGFSPWRWSKASSLCFYHYPVFPATWFCNLSPLFLAVLGLLAYCSMLHPAWKWKSPLKFLKLGFNIDTFFFSYISHLWEERQINEIG